MGGGLNSFFFSIMLESCIPLQWGCIPKQMLSMIVCLFYHKRGALFVKTAFC